MSKRKVIVIGAGLGGLTAAYRLQAAGLDVQVLEANSFPGGRVRTVHREGFIMDVGADAIGFEFYPEYLKLLGELGLGDEVVPASTTIGSLRDGRIITIDIARKWALPFTQLLSWRAKLQLLRGVVEISMKKMIKGMSISHLYRHAREDDPVVSAKDLCTRLFGTEVTDYVIDPLAKIHNSLGADNTSTVDIRYAMTPMTIGALKGGQARLTDTLARLVPITYGCKVKSVEEVSPNRVAVSYLDSSGESRRTDADACVIAAMYDDIAEMYPRFARITTEYNARLKYMRFIKVHLAYGVKADTEAFVVQVPNIEDEDLMMIFLDHNKCSDRAPAGSSLISPIISGNATDKYLHCSDEELTQWGRNRVEKIFPELRGHFLFAEISRWPVVTQLNVPGYYRQVAPILEQLSESDNVQIACDMFSKSSQETAVSWGNRAANNLINYGLDVKTSVDEVAA